MQTHQFSEEQNKTFRFEGRNWLYGNKICSFNKNEHAKPEKR